MNEFEKYLAENPHRKQWITVKDLKKLLNYFPDDTMICVDNSEMFDRGTYYATQDSIDFFKVEGVSHLIIGTNYYTKALGEDK